MRYPIDGIFSQKQVFYPSKRLGQSFLTNQGVLEKIISASNLSKNSFVLEVGPGKGILTGKLAEKAGKVVAVEKDSRLVPFLRENFKGAENVKIVEADILKVKDKDLCSWFGRKKYKIVANIPYYLTSALIRKFLEAEYRPSEMILMLQKEVSRRICAKPPEMNLLALSVQFYAKPEILFSVSRGSFHPKPKVDSAVVKISKIKSQKSKIDAENFFRMAKAGFKQPRKQLINNLSEGLKTDKNKIKEWLIKIRINPSDRPGNLSLVDWLKLAKDYKID